jgi:inner membrane protein
VSIDASAIDVLVASLGHIAVGMAAGRVWAGARAGRAMAGFSALSLLPDLDVAGMALGVSYGAPWGHRGATHSLAVAVLLGVAVAFVARVAGRSVVRTALLAVAVAASHGVLDAMTDGGKGIALLWPFSERRIFLPWRPIPVAPIGLGLFSGEGLAVVAWEALVFSPLVVFALWPRASRR